MALNRLETDEKMTLNSTEGHSGQRGGAQSWNIINEPGLYVLVLGSKKPEARAFRHWITHDVIPSIRKDGGYILGQDTLSDDDLIAKALILAQRKIEERTRQLAAANATIQVLEPKASYYDAILASPNSVTITQIAKDYGMSAIKFNQLLHDLGIQYKASDGQWLLYQKHAAEGYTQSVTSYDVKGNAHMHTRWTQKGRLFLYDMLKEQNVLPVRDEEAQVSSCHTNSN